MPLFLIFLGISFGNVMSSILDREFSRGRLAFSILLAINSGRSAQHCYQLYEVSTLFSQAHELISKLYPEINRSIHLLQLRFSLAENEFEQEFYAVASKSFMSKIVIKTKGIIIEPECLKNLINEMAELKTSYPLPLIKLLGIEDRNEIIYSPLDLVKPLPYRYWFSILYCIKYWQTFSHHITIASLGYFKEHARAFKESNDHSLTFQVNLIDKFQRIAFGEFDHFSSFGNIICTYYYFEYLRQLLRTACNLDESDVERFELYNLIRKKWDLFLNHKISIRSEKKDERSVISWIYKGTFFGNGPPRAKCIQIDKIKVKRVYNADQSRSGLVSSIVLRNNFVVYVSSNEDGGVFEEIMKVLIERITKTSGIYTVSSVISNIL
jgi:hypothetical protein